MIDSAGIDLTRLWSEGRLVGGGSGMRICPACHEISALSASSCPTCGTPSTRATVPLRATRTVTVLSVALVESAPTRSDLDPAAVRLSSQEWLARTKVEIERHGGRVQRLEVNGVLAVFGLPASNADDAPRAAGTALDLIDLTRRYAATLEHHLGRGLGVRVGLESGEVVVTFGIHNEVSIFGTAVKAATRLQGLARTNTCLIGPDVAGLLDGWADIAARPGVDMGTTDTPGQTYDLISVRSHRPDRPGRHSLPFVGRNAELEALRAVAAQAHVSRTPRVIALIGEAGVGKSRVVHQALMGIDALIVRGRCPAYGDGSGLYPMAQIVRDVAGFISHQPTIDELRTALYKRLGPSPSADDIVSVLSRIDDAYGATPPQVDDVVWAMRELVTSLGRNRDLVVLIEDIHWASPRLVRLMSRVANEVRKAGVLVVFTARPERANDPASWFSQSDTSTVITLAPLPDADIRELVRQTVPDAESSFLDEIVAAAQGNPLYIHMLLQERWLEPDSALPSGVFALATQRLMKLPADERLLLGEAAILGRVFYPRGVRFLAQADARQMNVLWHRLLDRRLVHESATDLVDEPALAFDHAVVQEMAYSNLPAAVRVELHSAAAEWLGGISRHPSTVGSVAHHRRMAALWAESVSQSSTEISVLRELSARAAFDAAHSLDVASAGAVADYLHQALRDSGDVELRTMAAVDLLGLGDKNFSAEAVALIAHEAAAVERPDLGHLVKAGLAYRKAMDVDESLAIVEHHARAALMTTTELGSDELMTRALIAVGQGEQWIDPASSVDALRRARMLISANDHLLKSRTDLLLLGVASNLVASFDDVQAIVNEVMATSSSFSVEHRAIGVLARYAANADQAEDLDVLLHRQQELAPRLRRRQLAVDIAYLIAPALATAGRHIPALELWRQYLTQLGADEAIGQRSLVIPEMVLSLLALRRFDEARELLGSTTVVADDENHLGQALWHAASARVLALDGNGARVHEHVAKALAAINDMGFGGGAPERLRLQLARALSDIGDVDEALALGQQARRGALDLHETAFVRQADALLMRAPMHR